MSNLPIISHPPNNNEDSGKLLKNHLQQVQSNALEVNQTEYTAPKGTPISVLIEIAALLHDIGKANPDVQEYLRDEDIHNGPSHAPLGAAATFYAATSRGIPDIDASIAAIAVARHHQSLPNKTKPANYLRGFRDTYLESLNGESELEKVINKIGKTSSEAPDVVDEILKDVSNSASWNEFAEQIINNQLNQPLFQSTFDITGRVKTEVTSERYYTSLLKTWSSLTLGDKIDAASLTVNDATPPSQHPPTSKLYDKVETLGQNSDSPREKNLNELRQDAFDLVNGKNRDGGTIHRFSKTNNNVATLTLPTGLGKTFTGLTAAFTLRDLIPDSNQVIYALPYTSIIDQTNEKIQDVFDYNISDPEYTIHHYLSDTVTRIADDNVGDYTRDERLLGECWQANTVLTTFVQLFESIIGPKNSQGLKLPNLANSVIVLDEPQTLPIDDWDYIRDAINILVEAYGATVILMTATQPRLFEKDDRFNPMELVEGIEDTFSPGAERVTYSFDPSVHRDNKKITHTQAAEKIVDNLEFGNSSLAISNTIDSARKITERVNDKINYKSNIEPIQINEAYDDLIKQMDPGENAPPTAESINKHYPDVEKLIKHLHKSINQNTPALTLHLTTRHRPVDRQILINTIEELHDNNDLPPIVVVATQLIEAGVDLSFEYVYRDFAPLDSIVQAAGRCNREFERSTGEVKVWHLQHPDKPDRKDPATAVYGSSGNNTLAVTYNAIEDVIESLPANDIDDSDISLHAVNKFYTRIQNRTSVSESPIQNAETKKLYDYSIIDKRCIETLEIFPVRTIHERETLNEIRKLYAEYKFSEANKQIQALSNRFISLGVYTTDPPIMQGATPISESSFFTQLQINAIGSDSAPFFDPIKGIINDTNTDNQII